MIDMETIMTSLVDTTHGGFIEKKNGRWLKIANAPRDGTIVDLWLSIYASPRSMGLSDSFGVPDAWFVDGKWVHTYRGKPTELESSYITHWRPKPKSAR